MENIYFNNDNAEATLALELVTRTGANLFLTGRAGTGKTTFLKKLLAESPLRAVVAAPTGIAAINAHGVTLHSLFQLSPSIYIPGYEVDKTGAKRAYDRFSKQKLKLIRSMDLLVIDEVSMVRADLLDAVDASLRRHRNPAKPFGGVQLLLVGDLQQLPPVVTEADRELMERFYETPYFFSSKALKEVPLYTVELQKVYRQSEERFVKLLNAVRDNKLTHDDIDTLNERYIPGGAVADDSGYIRLVTHNAQAKAINDHELELLPTRAYTYTARVQGEFNATAFPAEENLTLKAGAQVMFLRNDPDGRYHNGTIGRVTSLSDTRIEVMTADDEVIDVEPAQWENIKYKLDEKSDKIIEDIEGTFTQYPLRTAWAITIHKSQGLTFDRAIIDISGSFASGQVYVALSRCRSLDGLVLSQPITQSTVKSDSTVSDFMMMQRGNCPTAEQIERMKEAYMLQLINEAFDLSHLSRDFEALHRFAASYVFKTYPSLSAQYSAAEERLRTLRDTTGRFVSQIAPRFMQGDEEYVNARIQAATLYYIKETRDLSQLLKMSPVDLDNKKNNERMKEMINRCFQTLFIMRHVWVNLDGKTFSPQVYNSLKTQGMRLLDEKPAKKPREKKTATEKRTEYIGAAGFETPHPRLLQMLSSWRRELSKELNVSAFVIASTRDLITVTKALPMTIDELRALPGWGAFRVNKHGAAVLEIVAGYMAGQGAD